MMKRSFDVTCNRTPMKPITLNDTDDGSSYKKTRENPGHPGPSAFYFFDVKLTLINFQNYFPLALKHPEAL